MNKFLYNQQNKKKIILEKDSKILSRTVHIPVYKYKSDFSLNYYFGFNKTQQVARKSIETIRNYLWSNFNKFILINQSMEKNYGEIYKNYISDKYNLPFWNNIVKIINLYDNKFIIYEHYNYFIVSFILKKSVDQDIINRVILGKIRNLDNLRNVLESKFICLNGHYSVIMKYIENNLRIFIT